MMKKLKKIKMMSCNFQFELTFRIRKDQLIQSIDEHEESVYSLCWSASASWVFASISYDGRVLIHTVPTKFVSEINRA